MKKRGLFFVILFVTALLSTFVARPRTNFLINPSIEVLKVTWADEDLVIELRGDKLKGLLNIINDSTRTRYSEKDYIDYDFLLEGDGFRCSVYNNFIVYNRARYLSNGISQSIDHYLRNNLLHQKTP